MQITLLSIGKTSDKNLEALIQMYSKRVNRYNTFTCKELPDVKNAASLGKETLMEKEAELIKKQISSSDTVLLMDADGKNFTSETFAGYLNRQLISSTKHLVFVIGGSYGFHSSLYTYFPERISLSSLTFTHQMVRLIFCEQLYRAFTILNNEPYHHA